MNRSEVEALGHLDRQMDALRSALDAATEAGLQYAAVVVAHRGPEATPRLVLLADGAFTQDSLFTLQSLGAGIRECWPQAPLEELVAILRDGMEAMDLTGKEPPHA